MPRPTPEWFSLIEALNPGQSTIVEPDCSYHNIRKLLNFRGIGNEYKIVTIEHGAKFEVSRK